MLRVSLRNLVAHKGRLFLTAVAIVLGVAFVAGSIVLGDTLNKTFKDLFASTTARNDAFVRAKSDIEVFGQTVRGTVDESVRADLAKVPGVAEAVGTVQGFASLVGKDGKPINDGGGAPSLGLSWNPVEKLNPWVVASGRAPAAPGEIAIDQRSADKGGLAVGDKATVLTKDAPQQFDVVGVMRFGSADSPAGASTVLMTQPEAQKWFGTPGKWDGIGIVAAPGLSQEQVAAAIAPTLPSGVEVLTGKKLTEETQNQIQKSLGFFNTFLLVFAVVALLVGSFTIYNTFQILVAQRSREIALLRAVGASRRQVLTGVLAEAFVVGLLSAIVGLFVGILLSVGLKAALKGFGIDLPGGAIVVTAGAVIVSLLAGVLVTVVAAFFPARRAASVPPVAAMRDVSLDRSGSSVVRAAIGGVVLALGVVGLVAALADKQLPLVGLAALGVFVGLVIIGPVLARPLSRAIGSPLPALRGVVGKMAVLNTSRNPKRTAATASAIMIGLGLIMFFTIFGSSATASIDKIVDENFKGDFVINTQGGGGPQQPGLSTQLVEDVRTVPGVKDAVSIRFGFAKVDGGNDTILGIDPQRGLALFDIGVAQGSGDALKPGTIAVSQRRADEKGWKIGDRIPVEFPSGAKTLTLAMTYTQDRLAGRYVLPIDGFEQAYPGSLDAQVYVLLKPDADVAATRTALEQKVAPYANAQLKDRTEFKAEQADQIKQLLNLLYALLGLAVIIAFFGIANTLALSIIERRREIGITRAVGMTRGQLRATIRWESVIIALMGVALGIVVGIFFSWAVVRALDEQGFTVYRLPVRSIVLWAVFAGVLAVLMALLPSRRAGRTDVLAAISSD